ncbi:hypothetical protein MJH12_16785, partial [bacterium]|nr:hypothetical protein [bacterium]
MKTNICLFIFLCFFSSLYCRELTPNKAPYTKPRVGSNKLKYNTFKYDDNNEKSIHSREANGDNCNTPSFQDEEEAKTTMHRGSGIAGVYTYILGTGSQVNANSGLEFDLSKLYKTGSTFDFGSDTAVSIPVSYSYDCKVEDVNETPYIKSKYLLNWDVTLYEKKSTSETHPPETKEKIKEGNYNDERCPKCPIYGDSGTFFHNEIDFTWDIGC